MLGRVPPELPRREASLGEALERVATNPKTVLAFLELAAKLNREIGPGSDGGAGPAVVILGRDATVDRYREAARAQDRSAE